MVYSSVMLLEMGVPVANVTPRAPVISSRYWHFINRSLAFWLSVVLIPAMLCIFVTVMRFLKLCASSTMRESAPSSSKVTTSSRFGASSKFDSLVFNCFFLLSSCLTVRRLSLLSMLSNCISSSSICLRINSAFLASESGIFSNWL